jgi:hypothetical protein
MGQTSLIAVALSAEVLSGLAAGCLDPPSCTTAAEARIEQTLRQLERRYADVAVSSRRISCAETSTGHAGELVLNSPPPTPGVAVRVIADTLRQHGWMTTGSDRTAISLKFHEKDSDVLAIVSRQRRLVTVSLIEEDP